MQGATLRRVALGAGLTQLDGYPFEVRYSEGALAPARAAADIAADAYGYFNRLFSVEPDIAVIMASEADWTSRQPYGLPFFTRPAAACRRPPRSVTLLYTSAVRTRLLLL